MKSSRILFVAVLFTGLAVAATFHASGALSDTDARLAIAARDASIATRPPAPLSSRAFHLGVDLVRLAWSPTGLFRALHLTAGLLLSIAAALSALLALRFGKERASSGLAGALLVGASMLCGRDIAGLGLSAHPAPIVLLLLSSCLWVWTGPAPRPALGGLFLGLATAEHPLVLFLLPGFGAFAMQGSLRQALGEDQRYLRRVWAGFLVGILAIFLPMLDASNTGLVHASAPHSPFAAIGAWLRGQDGACWSFTSPKHWPAGVSRLAVDLWHNAGPLGLLLGLAGLRSFFRGDARRARPFLLAHAPLALALVFGRADDAGMAAVLVSWTFLFWTTPALAALEDRLAGGVDGRAALRAPAVALLSAGILFALNAATIDHSREKGVSWTSTVLDTLPQDAVLVTRNPVALALSADGRRPDVDVVHVDEPSTLTAYHTGRLLLPLGDNPPAHVDPATLRKLVESTENAHGVFLDASVFFDTSLRTGLLGNEWIAVPHGLAFRVAEPSLRPSNDDLRAAALAWDGVNVAPDTPASPLRDGLTGSAYFARSLVQSAYLHLEQGRADDAEREFLLALGHPGVNRTLAAMGYARLMHQRHNWHEAESTLEDYVRDDDDGAWVARRFQGATLMRLGDRRRAVLMLQRALRLLPPDAKEERTTIQRELRSLQTPRPETPSGASETG